MCVRGGGSSGGGGGGGVIGGGFGGDCGISWDDPLLPDSLIFIFLEKALWTDRRMDGWMDRPTYRDARMHLKHVGTL